MAIRPSNPAGLTPEHRSGVFDRHDDLVVAGASAEIARESGSDLFLRRVWVTLEQRRGRDDEAGGAETALESAVFDEGLLNGVQLALRGDALDGGDLVAAHFGGKD